MVFLRSRGQDVNSPAITTGGIPPAKPLWLRLRRDMATSQEVAKRGA